MMKNILISVFLLSFFISDSQTFTKLTNYQNPDLNGEEVIFKRDSQVYRAFENNDNHIEIWRFSGDDIEQVYSSPISICDRALHKWSIYKDYLIFYYDEDIRLENIFNSDITVRHIDALDTISNVSYIFFYEEKGLIHIRVNDVLKVFFDIDHKEFAPAIDGSLAYKSNENYYYFKKRGYNIDLLRTPYNTPKVDTVAKDLDIDFHTVEEDKFFCQQYDGTLVMIDKDDNVIRKDYNDNSIQGIISIGNNKLFAFGYNGESSLLFTINDKNLEFEDTLSTNARISNLNFKFYHYYNNKILFSTCGASCYDRVLLIFDLTTKKILPDFSFEGAVLKDPVDSLVFFGHSDYTYVLNMNSLHIKYIHVAPSYIADLYSFKYKENYYLITIKEGQGLTFLKYDYSQNSITPTNVFIKRNIGVGTKLQIIDDILYFNKGYFEKNVDFVDKTQIGNVYIHSPVSEVKSNIKFYEGKFYYFLKHDSYSRKYDLVTFDPKTKTTDNYLSEIPLKLDKFRFLIKNGYMLIQINNDPFTMGNQYENWKVINLNTHKLLALDKEQVELLYNVFLTTKDYYYSFSGPYNNRKYYKINIGNISNYTEIAKVNLKAKIIINQETYSYILNTTVFYCEGDNCQKVGNVVKSPYNLLSFVSPNKRYFGYILNNTKDFAQIYVYDRNKNRYKTINLEEFDIKGKVVLKFVDDEYLYLKSNNQILKNPNFIYSFKDNTIRELKNVDYYSDYFAINPKEIHLWDYTNKIIRIFDKDFNQLETVNSDKIRSYHVLRSSPLNDKIRVLLLQNKSTSPTGLLITYNSETRVVNSYLGCEDDLPVYDIAIEDSVVYAIAKDENSGLQIYQMILHRNPDAIIEQNIAPKGISIYPNPARNYIQIFEEKYKHSIYKILNQYGTAVKQGVVGDRISISNLNAGLYYMQILNENRAYRFVKL